MNAHLKVLRSLTPTFYFKRGDQASIIGGVIEFIKELHQLLQSLESKRRSLISTFTHQDHHHQMENASLKEMVTCCKSAHADMEAKLSESNVELRVVSRRIAGQLVNIITLLEKLILSASSP